MKAWLNLFRAVNLPTVPGDVLVGASPALAGATSLPWPLAARIGAACLASVLVYMFGLADNDIVGAARDAGRPIPDGAISPRAAKVARGACLAGAAALGAAARLPCGWWAVTALLALAALVYNRRKQPAAMGLCRGLDVLCGAAVVPAAGPWPGIWPLGLAAVWAVYIAAVTKYSEGEESDPARRRRVGLLIGGIVYLQLLALLPFRSTPLLIAGAALLVVLRVFRQVLPGVSAS